MYIQLLDQKERVSNEYGLKLLFKTYLVLDSFQIFQSLISH